MDSNLGYTRGPWFFARNRFNNPDHEDKVGSIVDDGEDFVLAEICGDAPNAEANARLIAAAPTGHELIARALADRIDDQWLKEAHAYLEAVNGNA